MDSPAGPKYHFTLLCENASRRLSGPDSAGIGRCALSGLRIQGFKAGDHAGAVAGGLAAFLILRLLGLEIRWAIMLSSIPGVFTILTILLFIRDDPRRAERRKGETGSNSKASGPASPLGPQFRLYLVSVVLFSLANSSDAFLLLRSREMGMEAIHLPLAWAALHAVKAVTSYFGGGVTNPHPPADLSCK